VQDFLTFLIEALVIIPFFFILIDIVNQARYFGGYQIPQNWQPPAITPNTGLVKSAKLTVELKPKVITMSQETAPTVTAESQVKPVKTVASLVNLPDPWTMPVREITKVLDLQQQSTKCQEPKPLLLLPPVKSLLLLPPVKANPKAEQLLAGVNLDKLPLRLARKVAKVLGIAQKVNNKDVPISFLRVQIKSKLTQSQSLSLETFDTINQLLAS